MCCACDVCVLCMGCLCVEDVTFVCCVLVASVVFYGRWNVCLHEKQLYFFPFPKMLNFPPHSSIPFLKHKSLLHSPPP